MLQKLKSWLADDAFYYSALIILVAGASFGLGRQSVVEKETQNSFQRPAGVLVTPSVPAASASPVAPTPVVPTTQSASAAGASLGEVVASKSGSKYHLPTCSGAKSIKPENLISFPSIAAAQAAGYTPAANCPGLQ
jgi:hypothetical protein